MSYVIFFRFKEKQYGSSGATSGLTSSLAFTPVQVCQFLSFAWMISIVFCISLLVTQILLINIRRKAGSLKTQFLILVPHELGTHTSPPWDAIFLVIH